VRSRWWWAASSSCGEKRTHSERIQPSTISNRHALKLGLFQALGDSGHQPFRRDDHRRIVSGLSRRTAAEFVLRGIPLLLAATAYEIYKCARSRATDAGPRPGLRRLFASALAATKLLLRFISKHSFAAFAWYRIVFGGIILVTLFGWSL